MRGGGAVRGEGQLGRSSERRRGSERGGAEGEGQ